MVWVSAPHEVEQVIASPIVNGHCRNDYLRQHIERVLYDMSRFDITRPHCPDYRRDLHGIVAKSRHEYPTAGNAKSVTGPPDSLERGGDALG